MINRFVDSKLY